MGSANCCIALHPLRPMSQSAQAEALFRGAQHDTKPEGLQVSLRSHTPTCLRLSSTSRPSMSRRGGARLSRSSSSSVPGPIMARQFTKPLLRSSTQRKSLRSSKPHSDVFMVSCISRPSMSRRRGGARLSRSSSSSKPAPICDKTSHTSRAATNRNGAHAPP